MLGDLHTNVARTGKYGNQYKNKEAEKTGPFSTIEASKLYFTTFDSKLVWYGNLDMNRKKINLSSIEANGF